MPPSRNASIRDRLAIIQSLIAAPLTAADVAEASTLAPASSLKSPESAAAAAPPIADPSSGVVDTSSAGTAAPTAPAADGAAVAADAVQGDPSPASYHPFDRRGPAGNVAPHHVDDHIPSIVDAPPAWWVKALASSTPVVASAPLRIVVTEQPMSPAGPGDATAAASPDNFVPTSPGAFDHTASEYPALTTSGGLGLGQSLMQSSSSVPSPPPAAVLASPTDLFAQLLSTPARPRAMRARNKTTVVFMSDARFLKFAELRKPISISVPGGLAAIDVVNAMLWHLRHHPEVGLRLEHHNQWLSANDFNVGAANSDGTPDEDVRVIYTGDRAVDCSHVLLMPRPEAAVSAFLSHARSPPLPVSGGCVKLEVVVKHEGGGGDAASRESPERSTTEKYTVSTLVDLTVKQLPGALCRSLFLTDDEGSASAATLEDETLTLHYNGAEISVTRTPNFRLSSGPAWATPLEQLTLKQLVAKGVKTVSFTTRHPPPHVLTENMSSIASSTSQQGDAAAMLKVGYMDEIEAMDFKTYKVRKRNDRKVWQNRIFAVDKDFICNDMPQDQSGNTKRPMRRIVDVESVSVSPENPKQCEIRYKKTTTTSVHRDELEFETAVDCKHFVKKIEILTKGDRRQDVTTATASPPKPSVGQRLLNFFSH